MAIHIHKFSYSTHCGIPSFFSLSQLWGRLKASYSIVKDGKRSLSACCVCFSLPFLLHLSPCHLVLLVTLSSLVSLFKDISSQFSRQTSLSLKRCSARKAFGGLDSWKAQKEMKEHKKGSKRTPNVPYHNINAFRANMNNDIWNAVNVSMSAVRSFFISLSTWFRYSMGSTGSCAKLQRLRSTFVDPSVFTPFPIFPIFRYRFHLCMAPNCPTFTF